MDQIKEKIKENTALLDPYASMVPVLVDLSAKLEVNPGFLLSGAGLVLLLILVIVKGWAIMITTITVLYPALKSIRAIESKDGGDDDKQWLTYWMVFGIYSVLDTFFSFVFWFIPYWGIIQPLFFLWLIMPQFNGALTIYEIVLQPVMKQNKDLIQKWAELFTTNLQEAQKSATSMGSQAVSDAMKDPTLLAAAASGMQKAQAAA